MATKSADGRRGCVRCADQQTRLQAGVQSRQGERDYSAEQGRGSHFDPALIDAFLACEQEFVRIANEFADDQQDEANDVISFLF